MTKHTQGEWGIATIDGGAADDEIVTEVNGCMVNIAAVFGAGEYSEARPNGEEEPHYEVSKEEAAANARLIAAAHKMASAIEAFIKEQTHRDNIGNWERAYNNLVAAYEAAVE